MDVSCLQDEEELNSFVLKEFLFVNLLYMMLMMVV